MILLGVRSPRVWLIPATLALVAVVAGFSHFSTRSRFVPSAAQDIVSAPTAASGTPALTLDEEQRKFLWDVEHRGNVLNKHGFRALAEALSRGDAAALTALLAADFSGRRPLRPRTLHIKNDFVDVEREHNTDGDFVALDGAAFVGKLLSFRQRFTQPPKVQINLMQLSPLKREAFGEDWQGSCLVRLFGEMGPDRPGEVTLHLQYQIPLPAEETLRAGHWLRACTILRTQSAWAPHFLLRDCTTERGVDAKLFQDNWLAATEDRALNTGGVYLWDFNRDGYLDMLVVDAQRYVLYRGGPEGKLIDVTTDVGLPFTPIRNELILLACCVDLDGDGWEDLLLGDRVYRNREGMAFEDYTTRTNLRPSGSGLTGIALADYDRDGLVDLYVCSGARPAGSWLENTSAKTDGNVLLHNKGNWQFEDVTRPSGTSGGRRSTFSAVWFDANNDGWPDLHVINEFGTGLLLLNQKNGTFREGALGPAPNDFGSMGVTAGDFDNDGNIDLYIANMYSKAGSRVMSNLKPGSYPDHVMATMRQFVAGSQLWRNQGGMEFEPLGNDYGVAAVGWAYGPAFLDLDNDGWLDLAATCGLVSQSRSDPDG